MRLDDIEPMDWQCHKCEQVVHGTPHEVVQHLEGHGYKALTWPDGQPVVDMSDVPELLEE